MFGGGESIFGGSGAAPFMTKLTTGVAIVFVVTSLALVLLSVPRRNQPGRGPAVADRAGADLLLRRPRLSP